MILTYCIAIDLFNIVENKVLTSMDEEKLLIYPKLVNIQTKKNY